MTTTREQRQKALEDLRAEIVDCLRNNDSYYTRVNVIIDAIEHYGYTDTAGDIAELLIGVYDAGKGDGKAEIKNKIANLCNPHERGRQARRKL